MNRPPRKPSSGDIMTTPTDSSGPFSPRSSTPTTSLGTPEDLARPPPTKPSARHGLPSPKASGSPPPLHLRTENLADAPLVQASCTGGRRPTRLQRRDGTDGSRRPHALGERSARRARHLPLPRRRCQPRAPRGGARCVCGLGGGSQTGETTSIQRVATAGRREGGTAGRRDGGTARRERRRGPKTSAKGIGPSRQQHFPGKAAV